MYCKNLILTFLFVLFAILPVTSFASESTNVNMKDDQVIAAGYWGGGRGYFRGDGYYGDRGFRGGFRDGYRGGGYYYSTPGYGYGPYYSGYGGGYGFRGGYGRFGGGYGGYGYGGYGGDYCSSCGGGFLFGF